MSTYPLTEEFFKGTVEPTVNEYLARPNDVRCGRLAAIVLNHLVDYWCVDTTGNNTRNAWDAVFTDLQASTPIANHPDYSYAGIVRDVADASKHAKLNRVSRTLTGAGQVKRRFIGAFNTAPFNFVAFGERRAVDVQVELDDGKIFMLASAIRQVLSAWRKKLGLS